MSLTIIVPINMIT